MFIPLLVRTISYHSKALFLYFSGPFLVLIAIFQALSPALSPQSEVAADRGRHTSVTLTPRTICRRKNGHVT